MEIVEITKHFVKTTLKNAEGGHDWFHTLRVYNNALLISKHESANQLIVELAALLHDIADSKFHNGDETKGPAVAREFLLQQGIDNSVMDEVVNIIKFMSFKNTFDDDTKYSSKELEIVQDADRLDAIGAIGIARCFNYGGFKNRELYNPDIPPNLNMSKTEYKAANGPTINHFYEKLLLLKDQMNTNTGKTMALQRHNFMLAFLEEFYEEWNAKV